MVNFKVGDRITTTDKLDEEFVEELDRLGIDTSCMEITAISIEMSDTVYRIKGWQSYFYPSEIQHTEGPW